MAHFARLNKDNVVEQIIVVSDNDCIDKEGKYSEEVGKTFCSNLLGGKWIATSYNNKFRKRFAGSGFYYDEKLDAFIPPKPYPSWLLNDQTLDWNAPIPYPQDGLIYSWDESQKKWIKPQQ